MPYDIMLRANAAYGLVIISQVEIRRHPLIR